MLGDVIGITLNPKSYFSTLESRKHGPYWGALYAASMSLLPPAAFYWGTTAQGWTVGARTVRITADNAFWLAVFFYLALVVGTLVIGVLFSWISRTYMTTLLPSKGIETTALCATPIFLAGLAAVYPLLWLDIVLATTAAGYATYLLYISLHVHLKATEETAFLFTCAALAFISVIVISVMGATAIAWEYIATPVFIG